MCLGQSAPAATTNTDIYTVPSATQTIVSTIAVCNRGATNATFSVAVRVAGAALANQHYLAYQATVVANQTTTMTLGVGMSTTDVITVWASAAQLSFSAFGVQNP